MGCSNAKGLADAEQRLADKSIEAQLRQDRKALDKEIKLLLLGTGESGKSTIAKQMKIIHLDGFTHDELMNFKPIIQNNALNSMKALVVAARRLSIPIAEENEARANDFAELNPLEVELTPALAAEIRILWKDEGIQATYGRSNEFQLPDVAKYCFDNIDRLSTKDYIPNVDDALRCRARTTGIIETSFQIEDICFNMVDVGGQRSERKKWIHCFQDVTAVIFCVAMNEYNQKLYEDETVNRMHEAVTLFDEICNSRWFTKTSMVLFLNKSDLFQEKIKKVDLIECFPEYKGGCNYDSASKFLEEKFIGLNKSPKAKTIYTHITNATDTANIKFVFNTCKDIILNAAFSEAGF